MELQTIFRKFLPGTEALPSGDVLLDQAKFREHILLLIKELTECLDEINYKPHVTRLKDINKRRLTEELVDSFKYWLNLLLIMGIDIGEFETVYKLKHEIVKQKIHMQSSRK